MARGSLRPAAASYRYTASGKFASGSAVRHSDSRTARNRKASSRLPGIGFALMRRHATGSETGSSREVVALVHSSRPRMSKAAGAGVMASSKAGSAKYAARDRRLPRHVSPKRLLSPNPFPAPTPREEVASGRAADSSRTNVAPRFLTALACGAARWPSGERRAAVSTKRAAAVHPETPRRQERSNVRPCWNRPVTGIPTGPPSGVTQRQCENCRNTNVNNVLHTRQRCASCVTLRKSRTDYFRCQGHPATSSMLRVKKRLTPYTCARPRTVGARVLQEST